MGYKFTLKECCKMAMGEINALALGEEPHQNELFYTAQKFFLMQDEWQADNLTINQVRRVLYDTSNTVQEYTIGPGADWDGFRPQEIVRAGFVNTYINPTVPLETPVTCYTVEEWAAISLKAMTGTIIYGLWYDYGYDDDGFGTVTVYPIPQNPGKVALYVPTPLANIPITLAGLDTELHTPPGSKMAMTLNLALKICGRFEKTPSPLLIRDAANSLRNFERTNSRPVKAVMPERLLNRRLGNRRGYNILTNQ